MKTVFTTGEAAEICKVSQQTIIRCFDSGQLKGFRVPGSRFRRIPRDARRLANFTMDDQEWESLLIPINLAFFVHNSAAARVIAQYPSPGGAMESSLDLEYWNEVVARNPILRTFELDVEALLVNRLSTPPQYYRAPIDQCLHLVGIIRTKWRGLSGGQDVWKEIDNFFAQLRQASTEETRA